MDPIANPYLPGAGMPPPTLVGRSELLEAARIAIGRTLAGRNSQSLMVTGLRGVGKTVLLNRCADLAEEAGFQTAVLEASETTDLRESIRTHLERPLQRIVEGGGVSATVRRALRALRGFSIKAGTDGSLELGVKLDEDAALSTGVLEVDLADLVTTIGEAAREHQTGIFLAVDELQYLDRDELGALIMAQHRAMQKKLPVLFLAAGLPQLPALAGEAKSYAERLFRYETIGALSREDTFRAVQEPAIAQDTRFDDAALAEIYRLTEGYPYFVQEWARDAWNAAQASPVTLTDVESATETVLRRLDGGFFRVRFDRLTPKEKKYIYAMAELGDGVHRSSDIAARYGAAVSAVAFLRDSLIKKGMIYSPKYGEAAFTVPLFGKFLDRMAVREPSYRSNFTL